MPYVLEIQPNPDAPPEVFRMFAGSEDSALTALAKIARKESANPASAAIWPVSEAEVTAYYETLAAAEIARYAAPDRYSVLSSPGFLSDDDTYTIVDTKLNQPVATVTDASPAMMAEILIAMNERAQRSK